MKITASIAEIAQDTKAWLVDIWGVMHNGVAPFPDAVIACQTFRRQGGIVILVSNAPRPNSAVGLQLDTIGVAQSAYDAIISSGDISRVLIAALHETPTFHLGPQRDRPLFEGLKVTLVDDAEAAHAVVCTGLYDDETETPQTYNSTLAAFAGRGLTMICANPDLAVERGGRIIPCAGAVAAHYENLGGRVIYAGKPHPPIYDTAFALVDHLAGTVVRSHILAIGDGVNTDIAGAARAGIPSVYIASGVHLKTALNQAALEHLFPLETGRPIAAMTALAW
jgi:HAD superfamily hydrolase (TIGR01459 family)